MKGVENDAGALPLSEDRAVANGAGQAVSAVPASVPSALERAARAIASNKRGLPPHATEIDRIWTSYCGQARAALSAAWTVAPPLGLENAIEEFKAALPGYWFTVGECQVSADASCGPTVESPDIALIPLDRQFDDGFHADLPLPATMADALRNVQAQAIEARRAETETGSVHESAVGNADAPKEQQP